MAQRFRTLVLVALALLVAGIGPAWAQATPPATSPIDQPFGEVVFEPLDSQAGLMGVVDRGLFHGRIVVRGGSSGLTIINELSPEDYLKGIAEIPASWPLEAQKAQVIAARTYMLSQKINSAYADYGADICATDACQVYQGADREPATPLWQEAVRETSGQVMMYDGSPILAQFHSTDGGHTLSHLQVFGTEIPYLQGVDDPDDVVSPYHHWTVPMPLADLEESLRSRAETSPPPGRLVSIERTLLGPLVVKTEEDSPDPGQPPITHQAELDPVRVLIRLNNDAPSRFPGRYPSATESGSGSLPDVIPHEDFNVSTANGVATFTGGGWGHKVGMSQYGAKGKAERGLGAFDILAAYYTGVSFFNYPMPPTLRVLLGYGLGSRKLASNGPFRITDGNGQVIASSTLGGWTVSDEGGLVRLTPPEGADVPLTLSLPQVVPIGPEAPSVRPAPLPVGVPAPAGPAAPALGAARAIPGAIRFTLSSPARVDASLEGGDGTKKLPSRVLDAGEKTIAFGDLFNRVLPKPGSYKVHLVASDTRGSKVESVVDFDVVANARAAIPTSDALFGLAAVAPEAAGPPSARAQPGSGGPAGGGSSFPWAYVIAVAALVAVAVAVWRVRIWLDRLDPVASAPVSEPSPDPGAFWLPPDPDPDGGSLPPEREPVVETNGDDAPVAGEEPPAGPRLRRVRDRTGGRLT